MSKKYSKPDNKHVPQVGDRYRDQTTHRLCEITRIEEDKVSMKAIETMTPSGRTSRLSRVSRRIFDRNWHWQPAH